MADPATPTTPEPESNRLNLRLSPEARDAIQKIAAKFGGISAAEVVRRAIGTELFLLEEKDRGSKILIEDNRGNVRQLVLR